MKAEPTGDDFSRALEALALGATAADLPPPRLRFFDAVASTNSLAMADVRSGAAREGDLYLALEQTGGRGTRGRSFCSPRGMGLWFSLVVGRMAPRPLPFWPAAALVELARARGVAAHLKWPNDVLVGRRKLAGILVETATESGQAALHVVGVGLNVAPRGRPAALDHVATSLIEEGAAAEALPDLLAELLLRMRELVGADLVEAFRGHTRMIGRTLQFVFDDGATRALRVLDVDEAGHLWVEDQAGARRRIVSQSEASIDPAELARDQEDVHR